LIKASFLVVSPCGENSITEKIDTAGAAVFLYHFFSYNSAGDQLQTELPQKK